MAKQVINFGTTINDGTGDSLRNGAQKINSNFTELYELLGGSESISIVTKITAGPGLVASSPTGDITISTLPATDTQQGLVTIGSGIDVDDAGVISVTPYSLPKAATNILGGIRVGDNLTINNDGVLSAVATPYSLPTASPTVKGGVKIGSGLEIVDSVLNVTTSEIAAALQNGGSTVALEVEAGVNILRSNLPVKLESQSLSSATSLEWIEDIEQVDTAISKVLVNTTGIELSVGAVGSLKSLIFNSTGILEFSSGAVIDSSDTNFEVRSDNNINFEATGVFNIYTDTANDAFQWQFGDDGIFSTPAALQINGNTDAITIQLDQLTEDASAKSEEINVVQNSIGSKQSELSFWQGVASSGPSNPQYGEALSRIGVLTSEIGILQGTLSVLQGEFSVIQGNLTSANELLSNSSVTLTYVVEDGVLDINQGAVRFPDGTIQTTAYLGTALPDITVDRLTNGENEVILDAQGVLTVVGTIYSASNMSVESITDTTITAGTDLKLYSSGLFALRNYSITDSIAISTGYNSEGEKNWLFNTSGTLTLPDGESNISALDPATNGGINGISVAGKERTFISIGDALEYGYNWDFRAFGLNDFTSTAKPTIKFPGSGWLQEDVSDLSLGGFNVPLQLGSQGSITLTTTFHDEIEEFTRSWVFDSDGSLTFPDNTVQTTAYNVTSRSDDSSNVLAVGSTMTREWLKVRITVVDSTEVVVEFNYANPEASVTLSGNNGTTNFFNGATTVLAGNVIYYPITTAPLVQVGDLVTAIIADHSYGKVYRITAMYRDIPSEGTIGSVYCTIEQLM